jgi:hypothetical protein
MTDQQQSPFESVAPAAGGASLAHAIGARNLMIIIITMPLVFLIVVMATIAVFGRPGDGKEKSAAGERVVAAVERPTLVQPEPAAPATAGVIAPSPASLSVAPAPLILPPGADIASMALDGDRLVLHIDGEDGGEIVVYDLKTGAALSRIAVKRQVAADGGDL